MKPTILNLEILTFSLKAKFLNLSFSLPFDLKNFILFAILIDYYLSSYTSTSFENIYPYIFYSPIHISHFSENPSSSTVSV